jgi:hypothetical protein
VERAALPQRGGVMVRRALGITIVAASCFATGFLYACICAAGAVKDGRLDPAIDEMRARRGA